MSNFDTAGKNLVLEIPLVINATDFALKAAFNGAGYAVAPFPMNIDKVQLCFAHTAGVNGAGSGSTAVGLYINGTAAHTATFGVSYSSSEPYATLDRASLTTKAIAEGDVLRIDVLSVYGGAATSYAIGAVVRVVGQSIG